jgi:mRNA interferase RelE/StbE
MAWRVEFAKNAARDLGKIDRQDRRRILGFLRDRVESSPDPRALGEALRGKDLGQFWKYRVGDFRIICDIQDRLVLVVVVRVGNRREVYR